MDLNKRSFFKWAGIGATSLALNACDEKPAAAKTESLYDRVMRTGTIRCGYTPYSVGLITDPNTGVLRGIYKDIIEEAASRLSLKAMWTEEVSWGAQIEGFQSGRYDIIGSPVSVTAPRSRAADYTTPLYFSPIGVWAASDNHALTGVAQLDNPGHSIATIDGEQTAAIADAFFPAARTISLPQSSDFAQLLMTVTSGKADVTFAEPFAVAEFMETHPNSLKNISEGRPLQIVPNIILIPHGQAEFKFMMNNILTELSLSGFIDKTLNKWEKYPGSYIRSKGFY